MEGYKSEIENWELGAGIYIQFYSMRKSLQGDAHAMTELVRAMLASAFYGFIALYLIVKCN